MYKYHISVPQRQLVVCGDWTPEYPYGDGYYCPSCGARTSNQSDGPKPGWHAYYVNTSSTSYGEGTSVPSGYTLDSTYYKTNCGYTNGQIIN